MTLEPINLSTGPVNISTDVRTALSAPVIPHRSVHFKNLLDNTLTALCGMFSVRHTFIMSGSGTLANEVMLHQIRSLGTRGLILSNGEFGSRLIHQAERLSIAFSTYRIEWGARFDMQVLKAMLSGGNIAWVLFCHCETSTGILNDLGAITKLCNLYNTQCFVDCMSSVGTIPLNLSKIAMATASSGKGLAAYPGLALLFSNIAPLENNSIPIYLDLANYFNKNNIPFTISSNLINALYTAILQKNAGPQFSMIKEYGNTYYDIMNHHNIVPFSDKNSKVFTVVVPPEKKLHFIKHMADNNVTLSYESEYLKKRHWAQLAIFGYYDEEQLDYAANALKQCLECVL